MFAKKFSVKLTVILRSVNTKKRNLVSWAMMELTHEQYQEIKPSLPVQRGKVKLSNRKLLNRIWSVAEQDRKWRGFPCIAKSI